MFLFVGVFFWLHPQWVMQRSVSWCEQWINPLIVKNIKKKKNAKLLSPLYSSKGETWPCVRKYILYFTSSIVSSWHVSSLTKPLMDKAASAAGRNNIPPCTSLMSPLLEPWLTWTFPRIATLGPNSKAPCLWNDSQLSEFIIWQWSQPK